MKQNVNAKVFFPDLCDLNDAIDDLGYDYYSVEAAIVDNSCYSNKILLFDLPNDDGLGGSMRCFLYPDDNRILGTYKYLKPSNIKEEKVDGRYFATDNELRIIAEVFVDGIPKWGMVMILDHVSV